MNAERGTRNGERGETQELLSFLLNAKSYPHQPKRVQLVQTHSSFVFIVPPYVYKVKKAVNFGFLDFSTLEKRRHFCEREVRLNRRLAPGMYLGVVPIIREGNGFAFGDDTIGSSMPAVEVVEWAVKMRKLASGYFLDQLVQRNAVSNDDLRRIASILAEFYQAQHPTAEIEKWGCVERLKISTDENFRQCEPFVGNTITQAAFDCITVYTDEFYRTHRLLFARRVRNGWIRDCHGDLHLEHVHLTPRELHIYDCIEFNDRLRYVDVASDLAFLAMDLDFEGRADLARAFITEIGGMLRDDDLFRLLNFYKCYRAYVRGKVESLHAIAPAAPDQERRMSAERARRYFRLALNYVAAGSEPLVLVVMGRIASGKSTVAQALGHELGWKVCSSDYVRKTMAGFPVYERSCHEARSRLYSAEMTHQTYAALLQSATDAVERGSSIILDATFARRAHRDLARATFTGRGVQYRFLEVRASDAEVKSRLLEREGLGSPAGMPAVPVGYQGLGLAGRDAGAPSAIRVSAMEVSDARLEDFAMLTALYEPPRELRAPELLRIRTNMAVSEAIHDALVRLSKATLAAGARRWLNPPSVKLRRTGR